jgi:hypothetical protein
MAWAIQYQTLPLNGSWSYTFNFPGSVSSYIVGIPYFYLTYPAYHDIQQLALSLGPPGAPSGQDQTPITVTVTRTLSDEGGNTIDLGESSVTIAVIAWTGAVDPGLVALESTTVNNGDSSPNLPVPSNTQASGLQPILSGFDLQYANTGHNVESVQVSVSASPQGQGFASLSGTALMSDQVGNVANGSGNGSTAKITGSLLATSCPRPA